MGTEHLLQRPALLPRGLARLRRRRANTVAFAGSVIGVVTAVLAAAIATPISDRTGQQAGHLGGGGRRRDPGIAILAVAQDVWIAILGVVLHRPRDRSLPRRRLGPRDGGDPLASSRSVHGPRQRGQLPGDASSAWSSPGSSSTTPRVRATCRWVRRAGSPSASRSSSPPGSPLIGVRPRRDPAGRRPRRLTCDGARRGAGSSAGQRYPARVAAAPLAAAGLDTRRYRATMTAAPGEPPGRGAGRRPLGGERMSFSIDVGGLGPSREVADEGAGAGARRGGPGRSAVRRAAPGGSAPGLGAVPGRRPPRDLLPGGPPERGAGLRGAGRGRGPGSRRQPAARRGRPHRLRPRAPAAVPGVRAALPGGVRPAGRPRGPPGDPRARRQTPGGSAQVRADEVSEHDHPRAVPERSQACQPRAGRS